MTLNSGMDVDGVRRTATVHIVSGSFGAGHDSAAREIAQRVRCAGHRAQVHDVVDFFPAGVGRALRAFYLWQIQAVPGSWGMLLSALEEGSAELRQVRRVLQVASRRLAEATAGADVVVSTHPFASQIVGERRRRGMMSVPAMTYLTDASVHPLWVHPFVDRHLAWNEISAGQARAWGGATTVIDPLVSCDVGSESTGAVRASGLRQAPGVDDGRPTALIVGGSLGIGNLMATARDVLATGLAHPIVLCGSNEALRRRAARTTGISALGWREDLPAVLRSVDVVVQNSGGFTSLEAMAVRAPVLSYRVLPGHGAQNADALEQLGAAPWARNVRDLQTMLGLAIRPTHTAPRLPSSGVDLLDALFPHAAAHVAPRVVATST